MINAVVCLQCGGVVEGSDAQTRCDCAPSSTQVVNVICPSCGGPIKVGARACPFCQSTLATCRCGVCLAWNLASARHCQSCGRSLSITEQGAAGVAPRLSCPRCAANLHPRIYADLNVDECDACGGLFLSPSMMNQIVAAHDNPTGIRLALPRRELKSETAVRYLSCPTCARSMNRKMFGRISGVVVDVCRDHGVWFDAGELSEVLRFVERGGLEIARQREQEDLARQVSALKAEQVRSATASMDGRQMGMGMRADYAEVARGAADLLHALAELWR